VTPAQARQTTLHRVIIVRQAEPGRVLAPACSDWHWHRALWRSLGTV